MTDRSASPEQLHVRTRQSEGNHVVLSLEGEVDMSTTAILRDALNDAIVGAESVVVDFAGVGFIDSSGLGVLMAAHNGAQDAGVDFAITHLQATARKVFEITGLDRTITIRD